MDKQTAMAALKPDFDKMAVKIEFLFRLLETQNQVYHDRGLGKQITEQMLSEIFTNGAILIYRHRSDYGFTISEKENANAHAFAQLLLEEYLIINQNIVKDLVGLPISVTYAKLENLIRDGVARAMVTIKSMMEPNGKEASNG